MKFLTLYKKLVEGIFISTGDTKRERHKHEGRGDPLGHYWKQVAHQFKDALGPFRGWVSPQAMKKMGFPDNKVMYVFDEARFLADYKTHKKEHAYQKVWDPDSDARPKYKKDKSGNPIPQQDIKTAEIVKWSWNDDIKKHFDITELKSEHVPNVSYVKNYITDGEDPIELGDLWDPKNSIPKKTVVDKDGDKVRINPIASMKRLIPLMIKARETGKTDKETMTDLSKKLGKGQAKNRLEHVKMLKELKPKIKAYVYSVAKSVDDDSDNKDYFTSQESWLKTMRDKRFKRTISHLIDEFILSPESSLKVKLPLITKNEILAALDIPVQYTKPYATTSRKAEGQTSKAGIMRRYLFKIFHGLDDLSDEAEDSLVSSEDETKFINKIIDVLRPKFPEVNKGDIKNIFPVLAGVKARKAVRKQQTKEKENEE